MEHMPKEWLALTTQKIIPLSESGVAVVRYFKAIVMRLFHCRRSEIGVASLHCFLTSDAQAVREGYMLPPHHPPQHGAKKKGRRPKNWRPWNKREGWGLIGGYPPPPAVGFLGFPSDAVLVVQSRGDTTSLRHQQPAPGHSPLHRHQAQPRGAVPAGGGPG